MNKKLIYTNENLANAIDILRDLLGLPPYCIIFTKFVCHRKTCGRAEKIDNNLYYIEISRKWCWIETLCHEMTHVKQMYEKRLKDWEHGWFFKGRYCFYKVGLEFLEDTGSGTQKYNDLPWEKEAIENEDLQHTVIQKLLEM